MMLFKALLTLLLMVFRKEPNELEIVGDVTLTMVVPSLTPPPPGPNMPGPPAGGPMPVEWPPSSPPGFGIIGALVGPDIAGGLVVAPMLSIDATGAGVRMGAGLVLPPSPGGAEGANTGGGL